VTTPEAAKAQEQLEPPALAVVRELVEAENAVFAATAAVVEHDADGKDLDAANARWQAAWDAARKLVGVE